MEKLSEKKVAQVLRDAENAIRSVTSERDVALNKLAALEQRNLCEKIAFVMHSKGIHAEQSFESLVEGLEKAASQGRLPIIQEALDMMGSNMALGHINTDERVGTTGDALTQFIVGDVG
jgi:hypothetical protein